MGKYNDIQYVIGIQNKDARIEQDFFHSCRDYYWAHKQKVASSIPPGVLEHTDVFSDSFVLLMNEIWSKRIFVNGDEVYRLDSKGGYSPISTLCNFLMGVVTNKAKEAFRTNSQIVKADPARSEEEEETCPSVLDISPEGPTELDILDLCVEMLPNYCKEVLTMYYCDGLDFSEIMLRRGVNKSPDNAKKQKSKCISKLRDLIKSEYRRRRLKLYSHD